MSYLIASLLDGLDDGVFHSRSIAASWSELWEKFFDFDGNEFELGELIFSQMSYLGFCLASGALIFFALKNYKLFQDRNYREYLISLFVPLLIAILLSNKGALIASFCYQMREVINALNNDFLQFAIAGVDLKETFRELQQASIAQGALSQYVAHCEPLIGREQLTCLQAAVTEMKLELAAHPAQTDFFNDLATFLGKFLSSDPQVFGSLFMPIWESIVFGILSDLMQGYQHALEISLFTVTIVAPLAIGGSLLPMEPMPVFAWLTGFWTVGLAKLLFNLAAGLAAATAADDFTVYLSGEKAPIFWVFGLFAPALSASLATFSGIAVWRGLTDSVSGAMDLLVRFI